jgi:carboxypeptidase Taq
MNDITAVISRLKELDQTVTRLGHIAALLEWDQETYLPDKAVEERSNQVALIMGLHHEKVVDPTWESLFAELGYDGSGDPNGVDEIDGAFLRESYKRWKKKAKVPKRLVEELARVTSISQAAWASARKADNFAAFAPYLSQVLKLEKEYALTVDPDADPYDTLLDEYEPGAKGDAIAELFDGLAAGLNDLMRKIQSGNRPPSSFLEKPYSVVKQNEFGKIVQQYMGYDTNRGRLDLSTHPFTTTLGPDDVRVTTRYDENLVLSGLFSNIHEAGHGLYEQGIGQSLRGTILADGTSLGIHESQSRFWGKRCWAFAAVLEQVVSGVQPAFCREPRECGCRVILQGRQSGSSKLDSGGSRRGNLFFPHHYTLPAGTGSARRRPGCGRSSRSLEGILPGLSGHHASQ